MMETWPLVGFLCVVQVTPSDSSDVVGHGPVQATVGADVVLPCYLNNASDVTTLTVEWTRDDAIVHVYKDRKHDHPQDEQFRGRTSLFPEEMSRGNISLKLTNVTEEDSGLYSCYLPKLDSTVKRGHVLLIVSPQDDAAATGPQKDPAATGPQDEAAGREGGNDETEDDKKQSRDQTGAIVCSVVGAVIVLIVLLGIGWKYKDRLKTWWNERWRTEANNLANHQQREEPDTEEMIPLGPEPE